MVMDLLESLTRKSESLKNIHLHNVAGDDMWWYWRQKEVKILCPGRGEEKNGEIGICGDEVVEYC